MCWKDLIFSGSYLHERKLMRAAWMLLRSVVMWPPNVLYALALPLRRISGRSKNSMTMYFE